MRAIGIDLGSRRIGVALSAGRLATPYEVVERSRDRRVDHAKLLALATEADAEVIVVGLPLSMDGSLGPAAKNVLGEVEELVKRTPLPVETIDERLTTVTADRELRSQGLNAQARRKVVDKVAAAIILQTWLDRHEHDLVQGIHK